MKVIDLRQTILKTRGFFHFLLFIIFIDLLVECKLLKI